MRSPNFPPTTALLKLRDEAKKLVHLIFSWQENPTPRGKIVGLLNTDIGSVTEDRVAALQAQTWSPNSVPQFVGQDSSDQKDARRIIHKRKRRISDLPPESARLTGLELNWKAATLVETLDQLKLLHRKTKMGCMTCRARGVKCDEKLPICERCNVTGKQCLYRSVSGQTYRGTSEEYDPDTLSSLPGYEVNKVSEVGKDTSGSLWACPYSKFNESRWREVRSCGLTRYPSILHLKFHLHRAHRLSKCERRGQAGFQKEDDLAQHLPGCTVSNPSPDIRDYNEGFSESQADSLNKRWEGQPHATQWANIYRILFSLAEVDDTPSPYFDLAGGLDRANFSKAIREYPIYNVPYAQSAPSFQVFLPAEMERDNIEHDNMEHGSMKHGNMKDC